MRKRNILTLEDALRKMTSLPARTFGFRDRGPVREGYWADLVVFDPARVEDKATYTQPHQFSQGFDLVLVNGQPVVEEGKLTGARPSDSYFRDVERLADRVIAGEFDEVAGIAQDEVLMRY